MENEPAVQNKGKELATIQAVGRQIDTILCESMPAVISKDKGFTEALILADGVQQLKTIFFNNPEIKKRITAMQDTRLGFMTDRSPDAIAYAKKNNKELYPYKYEVVASCVIEGLLNGYRITNNEMNIIAGNFYPAKNGKYRKIVEHNDISDFKFTTTTPDYAPDGRTAKVQCYASWNQAGKKVTLGSSQDGEEDRLIIKIKVNAAMGDDAIIGKALSKLFTRVLMRIDGSALPESDDVHDAEVIAQAEVDELANTGEVIDIEPNTAKDISLDEPTSDQTATAEAAPPY